ncbi:hypothetical protein D3C80_1201170 [compost metagenome]
MSAISSGLSSFLKHPEVTTAMTISNAAPTLRMISSMKKEMILSSWLSAITLDDKIHFAPLMIVIPIIP